MLGALGLVASVLVNYRQHRRGRPTVCQVTRRTLPPRVFIATYLTGGSWLLVHVLRGYPRDRSRDTNKEAD